MGVCRQGRLAVPLPFIFFFKVYLEKTNTQKHRNRLGKQIVINHLQSSTTTNLLLFENPPPSTVKGHWQQSLLGCTTCSWLLPIHVSSLSFPWWKELLGNLPCIFKTMRLGPGIALLQVKSLLGMHTSPKRALCSSLSFSMPPF